MSTARPVDYDRPPVIEVVCGVHFEPLDLVAAHYGVLWDRFAPEYPNVQDVVPLPARVEVFDVPPTATVAMSSKPPLPRMWMASHDWRRLLQVQPNQVHFNWRKTDDSDPYPHFDFVLSGFKAHLSTFRLFVDESLHGEIVVNQFELSYSNRIPVPSEGLVATGNIFRDLRWHAPKARLPAPSSLACSFTFELPDRTGRLHVALRHDADAYVLTLVARGIGADHTENGMDAWFDTAHDWIVQGFTDLTTEDAQRELWGGHDDRRLRRFVLDRHRPGSGLVCTTTGTDRIGP